MLPPVTLMSSAEKPETASEKAKEKVSGPEAMPLTLSVIVSVGPWVSRVKERVAEATPSLPVLLRTRVRMLKVLPAVGARFGVNDQVRVLLFTLALPSRALPLKTRRVSPSAKR